MENFGGSLRKQQSDEYTENEQAEGLGRKSELTALEADLAVSLCL